MSAVSQPSAAVQQLYLHPGQIISTSDEVMITTILGSCVSVCLWDPVSRAAGINHFLLPKNPQGSTNDARYGDTAMDALVAAMWKRGASIDRVAAKIFGGACVLRGFETKTASIGMQNVGVARQFLERHHVQIAAEQTGGQRGRKLVFDASTGSAWIKEIST